MKDERKTKKRLIAELTELRQQLAEANCRVAELEDAETKHARCEEERGRAEETLQGSRQMLQAVLDSIPAAVFWKDRDSIYLGGNRIWLEAVGLESSEEAVGKSDYDLPWEKEQADSFREDDRRVMESGIPEYDIVEPYLRADGTHAWAKTNKVPLQDAEGNVMGILGTYEDITERVRFKEARAQAEEALRESEKRYRSLFEDSPISLWEEDLSDVKVYVDGLRQSGVKDFRAYFESHPEDVVRCATIVKVIDVNRATLELYKAGGRQELSEGLGAVFSEESYETFREELIAIAEGEKEFETEARTQTLTGEKNHILLSWSVAPGHEETLSKVLVSIIDITERKQAEQALRESERKFRLVTETIEDVFWMSTPGIGEMMYISPGYERIWDKSAESLYESPRSFLEALHPEDLEQYLGIVETFHAKGRAYECQYRIMPTAGSVRWIRERGYPIADDRGDIVLMTGICTDITDRVRSEQERARAEEALREGKQLLERTFATLLDGVFVIDADTVEIRHCNPAAAEIFGYSREEMLGQTVTLLHVDEATLEEFRAHLYPAVEKKGFLFLPEFRMKRKDGTVFSTEHSVMPLEDELGRRIGWVSVVRDISERKRMEIEETALRERDQALVQALGEIAYDWRPPSDTVIWDGDYTRILGYTAEEMGDNTASWTDRVHPDDLASVLKEVDAATRTQRLYNLEYRFRCKDGSYRWMNDRGVPSLDEGGELVRMIGVFRDVTARRQAEVSLRHSKERLGRAQRIGHLGHWEWDIHGQTLTWSDEVYRIFGAGRDLELTYENIEAMLHPDDRDKNSRYVRELLATADEAEFEFRIVRPDGEIRHIAQTAQVARDGDGRPTRAFGIMQDISERKQAQEALRESEAQYKRLVENSPDIVWSFSDNRGTLYASSRVEAILGYSPDYLYKNPWLWNKSIHPDDQAHIQQAIADFAAGKDLNVEYRIKDASGNWRWFNDRSIGRRTEGSETIIEGISTDITERVRSKEEQVQAEEALRCSLEETARSQRLLLALSEAAQAVQRAHTSEEVYQTIGDEISRLGYQATIFTLTDDRACLVASHTTFAPKLLRAAEKLSGLSARDYRFRLEPGGFYESLVAGGEPILGDPGARPIAEALPGPVRPLASRLAALLGVEKAIYVPLQVGGEVRSLLTVMGVDLTEGDVPAMATFANQAAIAAENIQLIERVQAGREQMRRLARQVVSAQEAERKRISQELHDEIGQALTGMSINLAEIEKALLPGLARKTRERLAETRSLADRLLEQVRELSLDLRPAMLDDLGLLPALRWYVNRYAKRIGVDVELKAAGFEERLAAEIETALYRVVQEALTNIARHAQAGKVSVRLERQEAKLVAAIEDDGKGFDVRQASGRANSEHGVGLVGIQERAASLGGRVNVVSRPGQGTRVEVEIPLY